MSDRDRLVDVIQGFIVLLTDLKNHNEVTRDGKYRIQEFLQQELKKDKADEPESNG